ncbi:MAG: hypothetical protein KJO09_16135 [Gammaproteobacteria bacterium]|nr:hypothetical protein [Gammaproteobacteria bacterium]
MLAQVAELALDTFNAPDWVMQTLLLVLALGLPLAVFFAWAFELTPEGIKKEKDVDRSESITPKTGRKLDRVIIGVLAIALAYFIWESRLADESTATPVEAQTDAANAIIDKSIAVLPFSNRSPNPEDAFFTEGVHDDLLTHLSKIGDMHVISRTSVLGFAGTERKIPDIARELGVATIMEGAVQRAGNRVRINVQLIDGVTDQHLWAEIYDRELTVDNVFDIQSEITLAIAAALEAVLTPEDQATLADRPTQSLAAYDAYLRGMALLRGEANHFNQGKVAQAPAAFDAAIAADPDFGIAYAGKARALMYDLWVNGLTDKRIIEEARRNLDRARTLAPNAVETLIAEGYYFYYGLLDFERAMQFIDRAIEVAPKDAQVWKLKKFVANRLGRFDDADVAFNKAYSLDPLSTPYVYYHARDIAEFGRFDEALELIRGIRAIDGSLEQSVDGEAQIWLMHGDPERACEVLDSVTPEPDWNYYYITRVNCVALLPDDGGKHLIDEALAAVPTELINQAGYPEAAEMLKAFALEAVGRKEESRAVALAIAERISESNNPYPQGWLQPAYLPIDLPGLLGDLDGVRAAARDYEQNAAPDAIYDLLRHQAIADAFARAGDPDTAFDYVDRVIEVAGPPRYLALSINSAFDDVRDHPRYLALQAKYEVWAANQDARSAPRWGE